MKNLKVFELLLAIIAVFIIIMVIGVCTARFERVKECEGNWFLQYSVTQDNKTNWYDIAKGTNYFLFINRDRIKFITKVSGNEYSYECKFIIDETNSRINIINKTNIFIKYYVISTDWSIMMWTKIYDVINNTTNKDNIKLYYFRQVYGTNF